MTCLFFFIADCPACKANMLSINRLQQQYMKYGLEIKGILSYKNYVKINLL